MELVLFYHRLLQIQPLHWNKKICVDKVEIVPIRIVCSLDLLYRYLLFRLGIFLNSKNEKKQKIWGEKDFKKKEKIDAYKFIVGIIVIIFDKVFDKNTKILTRKTRQTRDLSKFLLICPRKTWSACSRYSISTVSIFAWTILTAATVQTFWLPF